MVTWSCCWNYKIIVFNVILKALLTLKGADHQRFYIGCVICIYFILFILFNQIIIILVLTVSSFTVLIYLYLALPSCAFVVMLNTAFNPPIKPFSVSVLKKNFYFEGLFYYEGIIGRTVAFTCTVLLCMHLKLKPMAEYVITKGNAV